MRLRILAVVVCSLLPHLAHAVEKGSFRVGVEGGQVGLQGDVGNDDENSVGVGVLGGFYLRDDLAFEGAYVSSSHTSVDHRALTFGGNWYFGDYVAAYPNLEAGAAFISNKIKPIATTGEGFGLYVGGGFDFELSPSLLTGIRVRYTKAFDGKQTVAGNQYTTVDDVAEVMLRLVYLFGSEE